MMYRFLADMIVVAHLAYVLFVVLGLVAIVLGVLMRRAWARNFWLRAVHLLMIAVVVFESIFGILCPLTEWEDRLRALSGEPNEPGSFVGRWAGEILFVDVSPEVLRVWYCVFGLVVVLTWIFAPPRWPWKGRNIHHGS